MKNKHNTQPQRVSDSTMDLTADVVIVDNEDDVVTQPARKLNMMVAQINIARNEIDDPEIKAQLTKILLAGGVRVDS